MFITEEDRIGTCYLEFQYCKKKNPIKNNKVNVSVIEHWINDSLLISDEDFDGFFGFYSNIFDCALLANGETGFDFFGPNYYDKETTKKIMQELKGIDNKYSNLLVWLDKAVKEYNGFYILGI